jgi:hypothetical protein
MDQTTSTKIALFRTIQHCQKKKSASVRSLPSSTPLNVAFRRSLVGGNLQAWHNVVAMVADVHLTNQRDRFVWGYTKIGRFQSSLCTELY